MNCLHIKSREDHFNSRYFDFQKSHKYLITLDDGRHIETTCFEHFLKNKKTDIAIDISIMDGCPMRCLYCASSSLKFNRNLSVDEIIYQVSSLLDKHSSRELAQITCSYQGIGEASLLPNTIIDSAKILQSIDSRIVISVSTACSSIPSVFSIVKSGIIIENMQFTMAGTNELKTAYIAPNASAPPLIARTAKEIIRYPNVRKVKINYILIDGVNNFDSDLEFLINEFQNSGVIVKCSYLNETKSSQKHALFSVSIGAAKKFCNELIANGVDSYIFGSFVNIEMSCGQLNILEGL